MEAILKRYSDIDSYNTAKANYMDANPDAPDYQYLYVGISQAAHVHWG